MHMRELYVHGRYNIISKHGWKLPTTTSTSKGLKFKNGFIKVC